MSHLRLCPGDAMDAVSDESGVEGPPIAGEPPADFGVADFSDDDACEAECAGRSSQFSSAGLQSHLCRIPDRRVRQALRQHVARSESRASLVLSELQRRDVALSGQLDRRRLRQGDMVAPVADALPRKARRRLNAATASSGARLVSPSRRPGSRHPNRWTCEGALHVAFSMVGSSQVGHQRKTHNEAAAAAMASMASAHEIRSRVECLVFETKAFAGGRLTVDGSLLIYCTLSSDSSLRRFGPKPSDRDG